MIYKTWQRSLILTGCLLVLSNYSCQESSKNEGEKYVMQSLDESNLNMSSERKFLLDEMIRICKRSKISHLIVEKNGHSLVSETFDSLAEKRLDIMSVTKAVTGLIMGILIEEQKMSLSSNLSECTNLNTPFSEKVSLRNILEHTSCLRLNTDEEVMRIYDSPDFFNLDKSAHLACVPGGVPRYSNLAVNLLSEVIEFKTGGSLHDFGKKNLFRPLGIVNSEWDGDSKGHQYVMAGLKISAHDMVKLGRLLFSSGRSGGNQIVPSEWVDSLWTLSDVVQPDPTGSRVSWRNLWVQISFQKIFEQSNHPAYPDVLSTNGYGGQFIILLKKSRMIIVTQRDMDLGREAPSLGGDEFFDHLRLMDDVFSSTTR